LARREWGLKSNRLASLAAHFRLELHHHEALSDARACAWIFQLALAEGVSASSGLISRGRIGVGVG
jgi:DNA polymerase III epsilon subunit-like protein